MTSYDVGDLVRLSVIFTDIAGVPADPTTVSLRVRRAGSTTTYASATNPATGEYYQDVSIDTAGVWIYRWIGSGAIVAAEEGQFFVRTPGA
jgi:hypothetical protein